MFGYILVISLLTLKFNRYQVYDPLFGLICFNLDPLAAYSGSVTWDPNTSSVEQSLASMLQSEIIFKQLQELRQSQQLQELASGGQFNGTPIHDSSEMFMFGNLQMMQHGGSGVVQGSPNGLVLSQSHHQGVGPVGPSQQQFGISLNQYSHLQGPSNNSPLRMSAMQPPAFGSSFMNQECNFSSDQISMLPNQDFQEKNLFGKVHVHSNRGNLSGGYYSQQETMVQRGAPAASLDPLEQKFLYNTDDNNWDSSFRKMGTGVSESTVEHTSYMDALPSGRWSALMQSAAAETSSSDTGIQEEWSGLSFQNPEASIDNQPSNFIDNEKPQNQWVDRNLRNVSSPSSTPGMQMNLKVSTPNESPQIESSYNNPVSQGFGFKLGPADLQSPQSYSFFPSLSMGSSSAASLSSHNVNDYIKIQGHFPSVPSHMANIFPAYSAAASLDNSQTKATYSIGPEFQLLENTPITKHSPSAVVSQHVGFPVGLPNPWADLTSQQNGSSPKTNNFSSNFFRSPGSASSSLDTSSGAPNEQPNRRFLKNENIVHEFGTFSGKSEHEGSTELNNSTFLSRSTHKHEAEHHSEADAASKFGAFSPGNSKGWNFSQEAQGDQSGQASSMALLQNFQPMGTFGQNNIQNYSICSNEVSNVKYQSQFSSQMAPSWFKHYETLNNGQMSQMYNPKATINAAHPLSGMPTGNLQENSLNMQVNRANACQGSSVLPSITSATSLVSKHIVSPSVLASDVKYKDSVPSIPMKRKMVAFDMVPWHKEVNYKPSRLQNISTDELEWAQASKRRQEEVKNEAVIAEDVLFPVARAKRRLTFTTQFMQRTFKPPPTVILCTYGGSNCGYVAYSAARLALGDACSLTSQLPPDTNDVLPDELKSSNKTKAFDFSKVVDVLVSRVKKLEGDLSRVDKSLSFVDIKVLNQELEKFSIINRFARFHIKAHPSTVDPASSSGTSSVLKTNAQRYVIALPMPMTVPEGIDCLTL